MTFPAPHYLRSMSFIRYTLLILFWICIRSAVIAQPSIIPQPAAMELHNGHFSITQDTYILANDFDAFMDAAAFKDMLYAYFGVPLKTSIKPIPGKTAITVQYDSTLTLPDAAYILEITPQKITITGKNNGGVFYGLMTLMQLIPLQNSFPYSVPALRIEDYPSFSWRGMHLDVARHFFPIEFIKRYIDILAMYKINTFHWHLTDDQGWRIEIKQYPKLTEVGAWRKGTMAGHYREQKFDSIPYGGFYTQAEIKEIVEYAERRNITVVPEIEMPGHALALLAAYPELACTDGPFEVGMAWGVYDDIICPNEESFVFLENVLAEVMTLFPSEYIHIGGDEAPKTRWKNCAHCQQLIAENNLVDAHGLQSYFIKRIEKFVNANNRKIIGWDEILEGGLAPNAAVMSWQGITGGIAAANQNHYVVMSPTSHCYFDYYQSDNANEPLAIGGYIPIEKVYAFNPVPPELNTEQQKYILGAQANMWTEYITNAEQVEYMLLPRLIALSEVVWRNPQSKDFKPFAEKLSVHFERLEKAGFNYSKALYQVKAEILPDYTNKGLNVILSTFNPDGKIFYTLNGETPDKNAMVFKQILSIDSTSQLRAIVYADGKPQSSEFYKQFVFSKLTASKVTLINPAHPNYNVHGEFTLVDGTRGSRPWKGNEWLGFWGEDMEAIVDYGIKTNFSRIIVGVLRDEGSWIYLPSSLEIYTSTDGVQFTFKGFLDASAIAENAPDLQVNFEKTEARYIKIILRNAGTIPEGNPGAGFKAWLFADEILAY